MRNAQEIIKDIEEIGGKAYAGRRHLIAHLQGKALSPVQMIQAFCYECQGYCADGRPECEREECPFFPRSVFNPNRKKRAARPGQKPPLRRSLTGETAAD